MKHFFLVLLLVSAFCKAQENLPFAEEVSALEKKYDSLWDTSKETVVFAGSSSIRVWKNLETSFPEHQIINSGFGGSQASDLLTHINTLILRYKPKKVFLYEGDNDIASKKKTKDIIATTQEIIQLIKKQNPNTEIVLIAAKPSKARWKLKGKYKRLNKKFIKLAKMDPLLKYANVWDAMLKGRRVRSDIFVSDGLHMNSKGYELWYEVIRPFLN